MNDNNSIEFEAEDENKTATADATARHHAKGEAGIADTVRSAVSEQIDGINTNAIQFPCMVTPKTDDEGRSFIEDNRGMVRYYLESGSVEVTEDHTERAIVAGNNQRALELSEMTGMQ